MSATSISCAFPYNSVPTFTDATSAVLRRAEYAHETCTVTIGKARQRTLRLRTNDPVDILLRPKESKKGLRFVGYYDHSTEAVSAHSINREQNLVFFGPTYRMKNEQQRVWTNITVSDIARQMCREYGLAADVQDHHHRFSTLTQTAESDWAFLCRIARMVGFTVYPVGVVLHVHERDRNLQAKERSALVREYREIKDGAPWTAHRQVHEVHLTSGDSTAVGGLRKTRRFVHGLDPQGRVFQAGETGRSNDPARREARSGLFIEFDADRPAPNPKEAQVLAHGNAEQARYTFRAKAHILGNESLAPTSVVDLQKTKTPLDGFWTVFSVEHHITRVQGTHYSPFTYACYLEMGTDSIGKQSRLGRPHGVPRHANDVLTNRSAFPILNIRGNARLVGVIRASGNYFPAAWEASRSTVEAPPPGKRRSRAAHNRLKRYARA